MPCSSGWYSTNGIGAVSLRNGVPDSSSRRVARPYASRRASPQLSASPPWCTSSRITSVRASSTSALVHGCLHRDLRVGDRDAVEVPRGRDVTVAEGRIEADRDAGRGIRPLRLQMLGRRDDDDAVDHAAAQQLAREAQGERRLAGAGGRRGEEVARPGRRRRPDPRDRSSGRAPRPAMRAVARRFPTARAADRPARGAPRRSCRCGRRRADSRSAAVESARASSSTDPSLTTTPPQTQRVTTIDEPARHRRTRCDVGSGAIAS